MCCAGRKETKNGRNRFALSAHFTGWRFGLVDIFLRRPYPVILFLYRSFSNSLQRISSYLFGFIKRVLTLFSGRILYWYCTIFSTSRSTVQYWSRKVKTIMWRSTVQVLFYEVRQILDIDYYSIRFHLKTCLTQAIKSAFQLSGRVRRVNNSHLQFTYFARTGTILLGSISSTSKDCFHDHLKE